MSYMNLKTVNFLLTYSFLFHILSQNFLDKVIYLQNHKGDNNCNS